MIKSPYFWQNQHQHGGDHQGQRCLIYGQKARINKDGEFRNAIFKLQIGFWVGECSIKETRKGNSLDLYVEKMWTRAVVFSLKEKGNKEEISSLKLNFINLYTHLVKIFQVTSTFV